MTRTTILVPCYNEAARLAPEAFEDFTRRVPGVDFLFVDDGSRDATAEVLTDLCKRLDGRGALLRLPQNCGKAEAVRKGLIEAFRSQPAYVGYWDADLATPLEAIPSFVQVLDARPDLVFVLGARVRLLGRSIERRAVRHYLGRVFATAVSVALELPVYDTQCGAKVFRATAAVQSLFRDPFVSGWIFDVEILARYIATRRELDLPPPERAVYELPLLEWRDVAGSKIRPRDYVRAAWDLLRIHRRYLRRAA